MNTIGLSFTDKYAKGSCLDRKRTVQKISTDIFSGIIKVVGNKSDISLHELEVASKTAMPEKIRYTIKQINQKVSPFQGCLYMCCRQEGLTGYKINIPSKNGRTEIRNLSTFMHEITHLLDLAINPKNQSYFNKLCENMPLFRSIDDFYMANYYKSVKKVPIRKVKRNTKAFLKNKNAEDKLLILKYIKSNIESEINAYEATNKYINMTNKYFKTNLIFLKDVIENLKFSKKSKFIDKLRYKIISKERKKGNFFNLRNVF